MARTNLSAAATQGALNKADFCADHDVGRFVTWLGDVISGSKPIDFAYDAGNFDRTLADAKGRYAWPAKRTEITTPAGTISLKARSSLNTNQEVLRKLAAGLTSSYQQKDKVALEGWVRATLIWGGVHTDNRKGGGNGGWVSKNKECLGEYFTKVLEAFTHENAYARLQLIPELRSNAGTTKIHSLMLKDFIIYDSRVAAALAWLVGRWAAEQEVATIPHHLQFACMRPNASKPGEKHRSPNEDIFPYFAASGHVRNHRRHALWNLRANWTLEKALLAHHSSERKLNADFESLRDVEVALFMMGAKLNHAMA